MHQCKLMDRRLHYYNKNKSKMGSKDVANTEVLSIDDKDGLWIRFLTFLQWYPKDMSHAEKKLVLKLDILILTFGCLSFFTKYLDQQAITNAYVSYVPNQITDGTVHTNLCI